jgi:hypothetical protein
MPKGACVRSSSSPSSGASIGVHANLFQVTRGGCATFLYTKGYFTEHTILKYHSGYKIISIYTEHNERAG